MHGELILPVNYKASLGLRALEKAIKEIKDHFQISLATALNLSRVTAPLFVRSGTGINDDLNGIERPVKFKVRGDDQAEVEIVQSLAKWKRLALKRYGFGKGEGLYTDMNAVRPDEILDNLHSVYVDQWDWEKVISPAQRNYETLIKTVKTIYATIRSTEAHLTSNHDSLEPFLPEEIVFVPSDQLQQRYPDCTPQEREDKICAEYGAVFIAGIGAKLADGMPHDGRAPDYDDWTTPRSEGGRGLNGDIVVWHPVLEKAFELSSMGIRVDAECLRLQLEESGDRERSKLPFHEELLAGKLPQTMGGGIGQSRLCMLLLRTAHIGEVAVGVWPQRMKRACSEAGIFLL